MLHLSHTERTCLAVVLAAGESTRMRSARPKVLHKLAGHSSLAGAHQIAVVVGPGHDAVAAEAARLVPGVRIAVQKERLGTAHAVLAARQEIEPGYDDILIVFGDTPLIRPQTFAAMRRALAEDQNALAVLGFEAENPAGYGRLIVDGGELAAIREHKDASEAEKQIKICNAGVMALAGSSALRLLEAIGNSNAQKEFYLTDAVAIARARGLPVGIVIAGEDEVMGVNDRAQLAAAESILQDRLRAKAMEE